MRSSRSIALGLFLSAAGVRAQQPERATFYVLLGNDTLVVERSERTASELRFQLYDLRGKSRAEFVARTAPGALIESINQQVFRSFTDSAPVMRADIRFWGDSASVQRNGATNALRVGAGAVPGLNVSAVFIEQILMRARAVGGDSVVVPVMFVPGGPVAPATVLRRGVDSATIRFGIAVFQAAVGPDGKLLGAYIPSQNVRVVRTAGTVAALPGAKSYAPPPGAPYSAQDVSIRTPGGLTLRGTLTLPQRPAGTRVPAVVTITGSGTQDRDETLNGLAAYRPYYQLADTLGRRGIAVLRLDDRGAGSDGSPASPTPELADDIRAAVSWLRTRADIDPRRLGLVGHSEGGIIGPMVASTDSAIAGVVIMAGSVSKGRAIVEFQQRFAVDSMAHLQGQARELALARSASATDSVARTTSWWAFFLDYDPAPTAAKVRAPVLILHGGNDYQVPVAEAEKLGAAIRSGGNRDVTVRVFPGLNHLFLPHGGVGFSYEKLPSFVVKPEVMGAIADWLSSRLTR